jgi:5'-nucleotidase
MAATAMLVAKPFDSFAGFTSSSLFTGGANSITILHTNDLLNNLHAFSGHEMYNGLGGFRNMMDMIAEIRSNCRNVLLLDAGNTFTGRQSDQEQHTTLLRLMEEAGYDAILPGHRDLQAAGLFAKQLTQTNLPVIASNYSINDDALRPRIQPYRIIQKGNTRIGIIGAGKNLLSSNSPVTYKNPLKEIDALATTLKNEKQCDLIICLSHLGYKHNKAVDDLQLASQSTSIDIIIGGHSRQFMHQPAIIRNRNKSEVVVNHAGHSGIVLGRIEVGLDTNGQKRSILFSNCLVGAGKQRWKKEIA